MQKFHPKYLNKLFKILPENLTKYPKWQNFAKSGHTGLSIVVVVVQSSFGDEERSLLSWSCQKEKNPFKVDFFISFESSQRRSLLILLSRTLLQYNASNLSGQARQTSSVTRWWNKKLPKFPHKNAQKVATHFLNDIVIIRNSPKITKIFGQLLWDNLLPRICKNHLIWSHCRRGVF